MLKLLHSCTHLTRLQSNVQNSPSQASTVCELSDVKLDLEKAEEPEIKLPTSFESSKIEFQKNMYFCFIAYAKAFVWITTNWGKSFKTWEKTT